LTPEQLEAMQSNKVDIVIVEGDYVWFIGMLPSYGNVRVADSNGEDSHSYWSLKFKDGSVTKGNHPWWEFAVYYVVLRLSPLIQGAGAIFGFFCDCVSKFVDVLKKGWEICKEFGVWLCNQIRKIGNAFMEFADSLGDFFVKLANKAKEWYNNNLNAGYKQAIANPQISVNTYKLRECAQKLQLVNRRITKLDSRLDALYWKVGLLDLWNLIQADALTGYSWRLNRCIAYLNETASDFENAEKAISNNL